jgi:glycosyltransferase involved in cell wall biosynthesis
VPADRGRSPRLGIVIAASSGGRSGAEQYARRIAPMLAERGHRVWIAAARDSWIAKQTAGELPLLETSFRRWPLDEFRRVARFCREERIDVFHSHMTRSCNFGALLQVMHGVNSVAHLHVTRTRLHAVGHRLVIGVSRHTMDFHRRRLAGIGGRWALLPNFIDSRVFRPAEGPDALRPALGVPPGTPVLLVAGTVCRRKGQDIAARALQLVRARHPAAVLAVAGDGEWPAGTPMDGVIGLGYRDDLPALLPHATVALVPSRNEPFSLAAAEAMACRVPVVAADAGGVAEVVADGGGRLVPAEDPQALAREALALLDDPAARERQADAGLRRALEHYAAGPHLDALERCYERAVRGTRR